LNQILDAAENIVERLFSFAKSDEAVEDVA